MFTKVYSILAITLLAANALGALNFEAPRAQDQPEVLTQAKAAILTLEERTGYNLTEEQVTAFLEAARKELSDKYVEVAALEPMVAPAKRTLHCIGMSLSAVWKISGATCINISTLKIYDFQVLGGGIVFENEAHLLKVVVTYDSSRYDSNFDPVPGVYGGVSHGGTLVFGYDSLTGTSGNKSLLVRAVNVGIGLDYPSVSAIRIQ